MANVFISHSSTDVLFLNRLVNILNNHGITTWSSAHDLLGGDDFKNEIKTELNKADNLIIVVSKNSKNSSWVTREITFFEKDSNRRVIPLQLDETNPNDIFDGLGDFHIIDFSTDQITGYMKLLAIFDKDFSFEPQRSDRREGERRESERRKDERRKEERREGERRSSDKYSLARRLRVGFIKSFMNETRVSELHELDLYNPVEMLKMINYLKNEVIRYSFFDENKVEIPPMEVLEKSIEKVWNNLREVKDTVKAAYLIDGIVGELLNNYRVEVFDRRESDRRESERRDDERRDDDRRAKK